MTYEEINSEDFQVVEQSSTSDKKVGPKPCVDEGLLYGIGFFETVLILEGACFLKEHVMRINASLDIFGIKRRLTEKGLRHLIQKHAWQNMVLKIVITECNALAFTRPIAYTDKNYQDGFSLTQSTVIKGMHSALIRHKSLNYGENLWAMRAAKNAGYDDCLFANELGNITESSVANLFIIENGQLITPPLSDGLLPGIIRRKLIELYTVREESITPERMMYSEGAFLTNCVVGVIKVSAYVGLRVPEHPLIEEIRLKMIEESRQSNVV